MVFEQKPGIGAKELEVAKDKIADLEKRLLKRHKVLSEIMEEMVSLKRRQARKVSDPDLRGTRPEAGSGA